MLLNLANAVVQTQAIIHVIKSNENCVLVKGGGGR